MAAVMASCIKNPPAPWENINDDRATVQTVMLTPLASPAQALLRSEGGEAAGLRRLQQYIWETNAVAHYADTRNGMASLPPVVSVLDPETEQAAGWLAAPPH